MAGTLSGRYPEQRRLLLVVLLFGLLLAPLAGIAHQFDHAIADIGDPCVECLQLDRQDDGQLPAAPPAASYEAGGAVPSAGPADGLPGHGLPARSRGPPLH